MPLSHADTNNACKTLKEKNKHLLNFYNLLQGKGFHLGTSTMKIDACYAKLHNYIKTTPDHLQGLCDVLLDKSCVEGGFALTTALNEQIEIYCELSTGFKHLMAHPAHSNLQSTYYFYFFPNVRGRKMGSYGDYRAWLLAILQETDAQVAQIKALMVLPPVKKPIVAKQPVTTSMSAYQSFKDKCRSSSGIANNITIPLLKNITPTM